jgi:hypothetical protein
VAVTRNSRANKTRRRTFLETTIYSAAIVVGVALTYAVVALLPSPFDTDGETFTYTVSGLSVCVATGFLASVTMLVYVGIRERRAGLMGTIFYRPQLIKHIALLAVTMPGAIRGIDRISHHGRLQWDIVILPNVIVLTVVWYFVVFITSLYYNAAWVVTSYRDRHKSGMRMLLLLSIFESMVVIVLCFIFLFGSR